MSVSTNKHASKYEPISLETVAKGTRRLPMRMVLHAMEGWGKTSFAAQAPNPIFLMTRSETGLWTLMDAGQIGEVPHFPRPAESWSDVKVALNELIVKPHSYKTLVLDTMNGAERLCHEHVCETRYHGEWDDPGRGFMSFHKGYGSSLKDWLEFLGLLDCLQSKGMAIILLCHTKIATFKNPEGADYDRYSPDVDLKNTWSATHRWADMVLFGYFETHVDVSRPKDAKGKGTDGQTRLIKCVRHAAYDAKNRHGLPDEIEAGNSPKEAWANFITALKHAKSAPQQSVVVDSKT